MGGTRRTPRTATVETLESRALLSGSPAIVSVFVNSASWTTNFKDFLQSSGVGSSTLGFRIDAGMPTDELPWTNLNQFSVRFDQDVNVALNDLVVRGGQVPVYEFAETNPFAYDPATFTATWTLASPVANDKLLLDLTNVNGANFAFPLSVLPGDVNRSGGSVTGSDVTLVRNAQNFSPGSSGYSIFKDVNGTGSILGSDVTLVRNAQGTSLPAYDLVPLAPLHVNAGGSALTDSLGRAFDADSGFTGGTLNAGTYDVLGTTDDALFAPYRSGVDFTFSRPVANGHYVLVLDFAEPDAAKTTGQRTFDVTAEGQLIADDFDVVRSAGGFARTVAAVAANVRVTDGRLDLTFHGVIGEAIVSAVVLVSSDVPAVARPYSIQSSSADVQRIYAGSALRNIGIGLQTYANSHKGAAPPILADALEGMGGGFLVFASPRTDTLTPRGELLPVEQHAWAASIDDFLYATPGIALFRLPANAIVAYENPARVAGGLNMLRADGSVGYYERADAALLVPMPPTEPPPRPVQAHQPLDANIVASMAHLRTLGQALSTWIREHTRFPTTWGDTLYQGMNVPIETFINPRGNTQPPPADWTTEQKVAWVNASTDYINAAPNQRFSLLATRLLAYENPATAAGLKGGLNLLFADGRVEFREMSWALETIRANNAAMGITSVQQGAASFQKGSARSIVRGSV